MLKLKLDYTDFNKLFGIDKFDTIKVKLLSIETIPVKDFSVFLMTAFGVRPSLNSLSIVATYQDYNKKPFVVVSKYHTAKYNLLKDSTGEIFEAVCEFKDTPSIIQESLPLDDRQIAEMEAAL